MSTVSTPSTNPAIQRAMQSVAAASARAAADPTRPIYHFLPPAQWMNDPNGTIYHNGWYHLFYQHNPYGDAWDHMHWGHARSRDLVHWEHLPIALWPSHELGEGHCFSGCAAVNGDNNPMLFYTKVSPGARDERADNEQWAAVGNADWNEWQKHPANPILSLETHGGPRFEGDWRDPYIFHESGHTFMVLGGALEDVAGVALYEAEDASLLRWRYCGLLYELPRAELKFFECPNFFKLGETWLLLTSPYQNVEYIAGEFDLDTLRFSPQARGVLDHGRGEMPHFYATNTIFDETGRCILLGWIRGFEAGRGWNGCLSLPRVLTLDAAGRPCQQPAPELERLRGGKVQHADLTLQSESRALPDIAGDVLEIHAVLELGTARSVGLNVRCADDGSRGIPVRFDGRSLQVGAQHVSLSAEPHDRVELHLFLDRSVLELFVNGGSTTVTQVIDERPADGQVEAVAEGGSGRLVTLAAWQMGSIW